MKIIIIINETTEFSFKYGETNYHKLKQLTFYINIVNLMLL